MDWAGGWAGGRVAYGPALSSTTSLGGGGLIVTGWLNFERLRLSVKVPFERR